MVDIKSKEERSKNMSKIRSKNTRPEMYIRSTLYRLNYRFRVNYTALVGHPDIYLTRQKVAVFIHGCYWHRHDDCKYAYVPKSNVNFWLTKFIANKIRDQKVYETLVNDGVRVLIIWECTVKKMMRNAGAHSSVVIMIEDFINQTHQRYYEI